MDELKKKAIALRKDGWKLREIAHELSISVATVSLYCGGVLPKGKNAVARKRQLDRQMLEKLYRQGIAIPEIARQIGVPATTLYDWRRESGLERNPRSAYVTEAMREHLRHTLSRDKSGESRLKAIQLYLEHELSTLEIAKQLGFSAATITAWLDAEGVERRQQPTRRTREKLRQANLGDKRYNWKGGITPERISKRGSLYMRLAREACFERDNYTCRVCGTRGGRLNAHHIWPFHRFPERMYEVGNLITLCRDCHNAFHKAAGGHVRVAIGPFFAEKQQEKPEAGEQEQHNGN